MNWILLLIVFNLNSDSILDFNPLPEEKRPQQKQSQITSYKKISPNFLIHPFTSAKLEMA